MLQGFRKASQGLIGKIVVTVMFGFLIVSFAIWGVNDIFRGSPRTTVATVGSIDISAETVRNAYQNEIQRLSRRGQRTITSEQARMLGVDREVVSRLVTESLLDGKAQDLGLRVSDQLVAKTILDDPNFKGPSGRFERAAFDDRLRSAGLTEQGYVREQRSVVARMQLAQALTGDLPVPMAAREAVHRFGAERRSAGYIVVPESAAGDVPAPTEEELGSFFEGRRGLFRAPEYRGVVALVLDPGALTKPDSVTDAEAHQRYDSLKDARFGTPERRTVQRIDFPTMEEAEAASARIKSGEATFDAIAQERGGKDIELGTFIKPELFDKPVADAAFSLQEGAVSEPVKGQFGIVLVRVPKIEPGSVKPFEEVAADIKREIAQEKAKNQVASVHDEIEDQRAGAKPLAEIAREKGLPLVTVPSVDRQGRDKAGNKVEGLPDTDTLLPAVFASDVGVDNEALRTRANGYVWFDVTGIEPARDKPLDEVRDAVTAEWRKEEVARRLGDRARELTERLDKGETLETLAKEVGSEAKTASDLARNTPKDDLTMDVVNRIFTVPVGRAGSATAGDVSRVVFKVVSATVPPFVTTTKEAADAEDRFRVFLADDLLTEYLTELQKSVGVRVNEAALQRAVRGSGEY